MKFLDGLWEADKGSPLQPPGERQRHPRTCSVHAIGTPFCNRRRLIPSDSSPSRTAPDHIAFRAKNKHGGFSVPSN